MRDLHPLYRRFQEYRPFWTWEALTCGRDDLGPRNLPQQSLRPGRRIDDYKLHRFRSGVQGRMINVGRYIDTYPGTHFHRWLIVNHLLTLSGTHVDDFFETRMLMSRVPFSLGEFNYTETEALCIGNNRFAEEVDFSPVKFHTINISRGGNNAGSKSLHKGGKLFIYIPKKCVRPSDFYEAFCGYAALSYNRS